jgi:hypothetical protein
MDETITAKQIIELIAWLFGSVGFIISLMLAIIAYFAKRNLDLIDLRFEQSDQRHQKIEKKALKQSKQIDKALTSIEFLMKR